MRNFLFSLVVMLSSVYSVEAQYFVSGNAAVALGRYNSIAIGGNMVFSKEMESGWFRSLGYQHFRHYTASAQDLFPSAQTNHHSIYASLGYEAQMRRWTSFYFSLGAGITHVYLQKEHMVAPILRGEIQWLVHLGERVSLLLPIYLLPNAAQIGPLTYGDLKIFYKVEAVPIGIRVRF